MGVEFNHILGGIAVGFGHDEEEALIQGLTGLRIIEFAKKDLP